MISSSCVTLEESIETKGSENETKREQKHDKATR